MIKPSTAPSPSVSRRSFLRDASAASLGIVLTGQRCMVRAQNPVRPQLAGRKRSRFQLNYILGSPMYGKAPLEDILPEVAKIGARSIDIWPLPHANHLEQVSAIGKDQFAAMLDRHNIDLGVITRYDLGPDRICEALPQLKQLNGRMVVTGAGRGAGDSDKERVQRFVAKMGSAVAKAEELGIVIGIENHANSIIHSPDSIRYFADLAKSPQWGLAMAPYHLPQNPDQIAKLIEDIGPKLLFFQAWQHGLGCMKKLPKEEEMLQMPGRGPLDFQPILAALAKIEYQGWIEIFMHPVPRGVPIRPTVSEVTAEINRAREYLEHCFNTLPSGAPEQDGNEYP